MATPPQHQIRASPQEKKRAAHTACTATYRPNRRQCQNSCSPGNSEDAESQCLQTCEKLFLAAFLLYRCEAH
eukprot:12027712-Karenia_brevis.AAC.1